MSQYDMPEHIFMDVQPVDVCHPGTWYIGCKKKGLVTDPVHYVRADLVSGDKDDPLVDGQFRWVSVGGERNVAKVEEMLDEYDDLKMFFYTTDGCTWPKEELDFIGPVIHPPEI